MTIRYSPVRIAPRAKTKEKTVGHEWRCLDCNEIVHTEPLIGNAGEETEKQAEKRHARIERALSRHTCPKK
jgi:hypothetical protein